MTVVHGKSSYITNEDASPAVANTAGEGNNQNLQVIEGTIVATVTSSQASTYQFVRLPSNCKIKQLWFESAAQTAGTINVGIYYATDGEGQRPTALLAAAAISSAFFASAINMASATGPTNLLLNAGSSYTSDLRSQPLWQAIGLTTDPGGMFDIVGTVASDISTGTGRMGLTVFYTD